MGVVYQVAAHTNSLAIEPVRACVIAYDTPLSTADRRQIARCLGWHARAGAGASSCQGFYQPITISPLDDVDEIRMLADHVSFYPSGESKLVGHVDVRQTQRIVNAQTATIYRDAKSNQVTRIELLGEVRYREPGRLMLAKKASIKPREKSGYVENALYRFDTQRAGAVLPAWGRARWIERFTNQDYLLRHVTYSTCAPEDRAWHIEAREITLDNSGGTGVARDATLRVADWPVAYSPYLSFPTSNARKSGFLMPLSGYSNVGGFDLALPYYWNIAPNYDATLVPHLYTLRGFMLGGDVRFLTDNSLGVVGGHFLPNDAAFNHFLIQNRDQYPILQGLSNDRWSVLLHDNTRLSPDLQMNVNYQQVSDDYYLQDFSTNLATSTENQLLRQGDVTYTMDHWLLRGMLQSYQTLHPINQSSVANIYERLPQLLARGAYNDLPMHANFNVLGQFDYFHWTADDAMQPQGARYHINPILAFPQIKPWGYLTPEVQVVENNYNLTRGRSYMGESFNRTIPRYSVDSGLSFERSTAWMDKAFTQTLEPRLYYLNVPFQNQSAFPAFDSAYMIFNNDQLFRSNRFSGFDRIGDANQLSYALTSRWMSDETGREKASFSVGQIRYFADRRVQLCYRADGNCTDNLLILGELSPKAKTSPIASRAVYALSSAWVASGDYVWDTATHATNNGYLNLHYQPLPTQIVSFGYNYLVNGNVLNIPRVGTQANALHQATVSYAWPFTERWSSLGVYSYNVSEGYSMMTFFGLQYDNCCWAARLLGGRTFKSLTPDSLTPQYNNNVYFQVLLKGLGSVANSDPASTIQSYLPGYANIFQH